MLGLLSRNLTYIIRISPHPETPTLLSSLRSLSTVQLSTDQPSLTVSYLVDSCGLSPESAISVSKVFQLKTLEKADLVLSFLKNRGFTQTQISYMVKRYPRLLVSNPEKTILPKMEFLMSRGLSGEELTVVLPLYPWILTRSLEKFVIPNFNFWRDLFKSDEQVVLAIKRYPGLLYCNTKKVVVPGMHALRNDYGLSESNIVLLLRYYPRLCITGWDKIRKPVEEARSMGFNPSKLIFVEAVVSLMQMKKSTWDGKMEVFNVGEIVFARFDYDMMRHVPACCETKPNIQK